MTAEEAEERGAEWARLSLSIGGEPATRTDRTVQFLAAEDEFDAIDYADHVSRYDVLSPDGWHYSLSCHAEEFIGISGPELPSDRWLSIAETLEFLPTEK